MRIDQLLGNCELNDNIEAVRKSKTGTRYHFVADYTKIIYNYQLPTYNCLQ